ncbi:HD-GYP domain-containing protein [Desulfovibrio ferrophilus]|uniref:Metal dependent phosphohydrolase n=1 Tax=Desulfovibrio ferrophilus TaxID=241368 RepID=A0A2Z6B335_9BACT|nr:HD-GYP domain-containing protein [Desulfovibrio ferrophilus]BBD09901.1 metal dependent phosphohydrolase [Desulfovibrio ferrophilus]
MIKKIPAAAIRIGMYVVDTGLDWAEHPYLYAEEGEITSKDQTTHLLDEGYLDAFIDTDRGSYTWNISTNKRPEEQVRDGVIGDEHGRYKPAVPMAVEIHRAKAVYDESLAFAKDFMTSAAKDGKVDYDAAEGLVEEMLNSVTRNHDALISLTKLKSFDEYTFTHCINVSVLSTAFGNYLGLSPQDLRDLGAAALFHDVGKSLIPPDILNKPGKLTDQEFTVMQKHPQRSYRLLREKKGIPKRILRGIAEHHEKFNGNGYPRRIAGDDIHPFARIIAVADVYDALTSRRVYKPPMMPSKALTILYGMRGKDFYPGKAESFIKFLGIYPVGSMVRLSSKECGIVTGSNPDAPLRPSVLIAFGPDMKPISKRQLDLSEQNGNTPLEITECLDHEPFGVNPGDYLQQAQ